VELVKCADRMPPLDGGGWSDELVFWCGKCGGWYRGCYTPAMGLSVAEWESWDVDNTEGHAVEDVTHWMEPERPASLGNQSDK
jgi:hypothetical protein